MSASQIYQNAVLLDLQLHRQLKYKVQTTAHFAQALHAVPLAAVEMLQAVREYPIVFARGAATDDRAGELLCYALTGLREGQNLYLNAQGQWTAHYVPAFIRRYPFVFAQTGPDQLSVCIDATSPGYDDPEGEPFFDEAGQPSALLKSALDLLTDYQLEMQRTQQFLKKLDAAELLMPAEFRAEWGEGSNAQVQGFLVVDEAKFNTLSGDTLQAWFTSGELGLLYAHLFSLGNVQELLRRVAMGDPASMTALATPLATPLAAPAQNKKRKAPKA